MAGKVPPIGGTGTPSTSRRIGVAALHANVEASTRRNLPRAAVGIPAELFSCDRRDRLDDCGAGVTARSNLRAANHDVGQRAGHLLTNRIDHFRTDLRLTGDERHPPVGSFRHELDDGHAAVAVDAGEVTDDRRRKLEPDGACGLDRERLVIGDAGAGKNPSFGLGRRHALPSRFAACDTTRAATPRAVVYLTPTTVSAPATPSSA